MRNFKVGTRFLFVTVCLSMGAVAPLGSSALSSELSTSSREVLEKIVRPIDSTTLSGLRKRWQAIRQDHCNRFLGYEPPKFSTTYNSPHATVVNANWQKTHAVIHRYISTSTPFSKKSIEHINDLLTQDLPYGWESGGHYRKRVSVNIGLFDVDQVEPGMEFLIHAVNEAIAAKEDPVRIASIIWQGLLTIHPFADGNGRTAVALANWILEANDFPVLNFQSSEAVQVAMDQRVPEMDHMNPLLKMTENLERRENSTYAEYIIP